MTATYMLGNAAYIVGNFDVAELAILLFILFFIALVFYLNRESRREGYPLEHEQTGAVLSGQPLFDGDKKVFDLPHGRGTYIPEDQPRDAFDIAAKQAFGSAGAPYVPTGDPMIDGVGPASWTPRQDVPEMNAHGHPKIGPMASNDNFFISAGRDPRGMPVLSKDDQVVAHCTDMWIDEAEQEVRYLEIELEPEHGSGKRLVPMTLVRVQPRWIMVASLHSGRFDGRTTATVNPAADFLVPRGKKEHLAGCFHEATDQGSPIFAHDSHFFAKFLPLGSFHLL